MRREPCATTCVRGRLVASTSNRPLTIFRSGETDRRYSYVGLSVRLPRQRAWDILPGARSFLNWGGRGGRSADAWCGMLGGDSVRYPYLRRNIEGSVGDVQVPYHKDKECHIDEL